MERYQAHLDESDRQLSALKRRINVLALARLGVIVVGAALLFQVVQRESVWGSISAFFGMVVVFAWLVYLQSKEEKKRLYWSAFAAINRHEIDRKTGGEELYADGSQFADSQHPYSDDLDIFGPKSVFELINRCATPRGKQQLAHFLRQPASEQEIVERQQAVADLAEDPHGVQQLQVDLYPLLQHQADPSQALRHFLSDKTPMWKSRWFRFYVHAAPYIVLLTFGVSFWLPLMSRFGVWLLVMHLLIALYHGARTSAIAGRFDRIGQVLRSLSDALVRIEEREHSSNLLQRLQGRLKMSRGDASASRAIQDLAAILGRLDYRLNMLVGAVMNMVFLWDFRQLFQLQEWRENYGEELLEAWDVVGEIEALNCLAILRINEPDWTFPEIMPAEDRVLSFVDMHHPLIPDAVSIANSYYKKGHHIALITGSNMAGKSTFLRTVGVNMVLALCGAPVSARSMQVSVMPLITYMRIKDSLQESTSTFKAELNRMKLILDTVAKQPHSYFLIDEMLRGTNSVDKYRGSRAIIKRLIQDDAAGMVATHDLQLASLEKEHPSHIRNYHFDIQVKDGEMLFDYKLKDGECQVFNASILLRGIGIDVDLQDS